MVFIHKQTALAAYEGGGAVLVDAAGGGTGAVCNSGSFFLGRFRSSNVMPSVSLVMPTTGGSPFLTNSHWPVIGLALDTETFQTLHTWQLLPSKAKRILDDLLVEVSPDLKHNLVDRDSCRPMVETALSFTHSDLYASSAAALPSLPSRQVPDAPRFR